MRHLSRLDYLDMEQNRLMGSIPEELGYLTNLKYLGLAVNKLEGQIPSTLGGIDNLGKCPMIGNDS
jgi:Leucine-rich repeat (LRR) protein